MEIPACAGMTVLRGWDGRDDADSRNGAAECIDLARLMGLLWGHRDGGDGVSISDGVGGAVPRAFAGVDMTSSYIGKVDIARRYAEEPDRVNIHTFEASFVGNHNTYRVAYQDGNWSCECAFFATRGVCSHIMALQRMLDEMLTGRGMAATAAV